MCGISGIISLNKQPINKDELQTMHSALKHRGPDYGCTWQASNNNVGFAHQRLSIIDTSISSHQPMHAFGHTITYNGELYNYKSLKIDLVKKGYQFKTQSDTEVIIAMYDCYKEKMLPMLQGMFAMAIYNSNDETVFLARDFFGEKPLYYSIIEKHFYFASEIKALLKVNTNASINGTRIYNYLSYNFITDVSNQTNTFFNDVQQIKPAQYCIINLNNGAVLNYSFKLATNTNSFTSIQDSVQFVQEIIVNSIRNRAFTADVKVGTSLSGGIDSSIIAYQLCHTNLNYPVETISAIFPNFEKDESAFINILSHQEQFITHFTSPSAAEIVHNIQNVFYHQDEPFTSTSVAIQNKVMQLASNNNIKVLLDGQGADELFGGYHHYFPTVAKEYQQLSGKAYKQFVHEANRHTFETPCNQSSFLDKIKNSNNTLANLFAKTNFSFFVNKSNYLNKDFFNQNKKNAFEKQYYFKTLNEKLHYDTHNGNLQELLRYADRNSMAYGVEVRLPYLNFSLYQHLKTVLGRHKWHNGYSKYLLRQAFAEKLPKEIIYRKGKTAYQGPEDNWMASHSFQQLLNDSINTLQKENIVGNNIKISSLGKHHKWRLVMVAQTFNHLKTIKAK
jgi:asparagine synthase (glutamine-hydrolysing)